MPALLSISPSHARTQTPPHPHFPSDYITQEYTFPRRENIRSGLGHVDFLINPKLTPFTLDKTEENRETPKL